MKMEVTKDSISYLKKKLCALVLVFAIVFAAIPAEYLLAGDTDPNTTNPATLDYNGESYTNVTGSSDIVVSYDNYVMNLVKTDGTSQALSLSDDTYAWPDVPLVDVDHLDISRSMTFNFNNPRQDVKTNTCFRVPLPALFCQTEKSGSLVAKMDATGDNEYPLGNYTIDANGLTVYLSWDMLDSTAVQINNVELSYAAALDKDALMASAGKDYTLSVGDGADIKISIPEVRTELSKITKTGSLQADNTAIWTITLGDSMDKGVSLAGGTVVEVLDTNQDWSAAYLGEEVDESKRLDFTYDADKGGYVYTFSTASTLEAPQVITVVTKPKAEVMPSVEDKTQTGDALLLNTAKYIAMNKTMKEALVASNSVSIQRNVELKKEGTQIDGNTIEWRIRLNKNGANVWRATVWDLLSEGLTVDPDFGIQVTDVTVESNPVVLTDSTPNKELGVELVYNLAKEGEQQKPSVKFNSVFSHEYLITFRTTVDNSKFDGTSNIGNTAQVDVEFPVGGTGNGPIPSYGVPDASLDFMNGFVKIEADRESVENGKSVENGTLSWKATPSTKMRTDYNGGTITLTLPEGAKNGHTLSGHTFIGNTVKVVSKTDATKEITEAKVTPAEDDKTYTITFPSTVDLNTVQILFVTKASVNSYYADDDKHEYGACANLTLTNKDNKEFTATEAIAYNDLKNNMVAKSVTSSMAEGEPEGEPLFAFVIKVNQNKNPLTEMVLTDDLSSCLYATPLSNLDSSMKLTTVDETTPLQPEDYEIRSVESKVLTDNTKISISSDKKVTLNYGALSTADTVTITVGLTKTGKEKLQLGNAYANQVIFAQNEANVKAKELDADGITCEKVVGLKSDETLINRIMTKSGKQDGTDPKINWKIEINNLGTNLGGAPKIVDTLKPGLTIDKDSIKLLLAKYNTNGTLITATTTNIIADPSVNLTVHKEKDGSTTMTILLPNDVTYQNKAYILKYDTFVSGKGTFGNTAVITAAKSTFTQDASVNINSVGSGNGTVRATLTMTKKDALTGTPVKGAMYGVFASETDDGMTTYQKLFTKEQVESMAVEDLETNSVDAGYTDAKGQLTFNVLGGFADGTEKTYYVREIKAPDADDKNGGGYELDPKVYTITGVTYDTISIGPKGLNDTTSFVDERKMETDENGKVKTGTAKITNTFKDDNVGGTTGGKHSRFTLYHEGKQVKLKLENGEYQFDGYGTGISLGGTDSTKSGSDSISNITITGLPWGNYELEETETAPGFVQEKTPVAFTVESDGTVKGPKNDDKINIDNVRTVLTITDNVEAEYEITGKFVGDTTTSTRTITGEELTQTGGKVYTGETIQGQTYTLVQTKIPDGYKKHENVTVADFDGDELVELTETPIKANVVIKDQDGEVPNAKIQIAPRDGSKLNETVDADNPLTLDQCVNIGSKYDLTVALDDEAYLPVDDASATLEVSADGSTVSTKPTDPSVLNSKATGTTVTLTVQKIYANVEIREYSEEDKNPSTGEPKVGAKILTGGKFYLYDAATKKQIREVVVDENAEDKIDITDLPAGNYYLKQDTAPNAYTVINKDEEYSFVVDADKHGKTIYVNVFNHPVPGSIEVTKTDGTKALAGAVYQLYTKDAAGNRNVVATATTDANGKMKFENLLWDTYYLSEVSAPAGYQVNNQVYGGDADWTIDVEHQHLVKEVSDQPTKVTIHTTGINIKADEDETDADVTKENIGNGVLPYSNLTYEVTGIFAGKTVESTEEFADDNNDGLIEVSNMFVVGNTYTFTQKSVKRPYNKVENFTAEIKTGTDQIEIVNHMNRLAMQLVNGEGERLAGGTFELYELDDAGNRVLALDKPLTSKIGKLDITGLVPGTYELVETAAPVVDGQFTYALDNSGMKFVLNENNTVKVLSTNADAARQNADAAKKNETKVDAVLGKAGSVLKMDEAVLTYVNVPTRLYFDVDVFYNEDCNKDKDATADLAGVYYTVCTPEDEENGFCIMRPISDEKDGKVVVEGLPLGTYEVKMSDSKGNNVILNDEVYTAEVVGVPFAGLKYANGATVEQVVKDVNGEKTGVSVLKYNVYKEDLVLAKTDAEDDSKLLAGSTYRLYRKDSFQSKDAIHYDKDKVEDEGTKFNEFVAEATTDADGKLTFEGVTVGVEYLVQEVGEPSGYQVSKDPIKVRFIRDNKLGTTTLQNINDGDGTAEVSEDGTVTWKEPRLKVAIRLVDEEGNPLSGGKLELKEDAAGSTKRSWTSSNENEMFSGELTGGQNYTVVQTAAPSGYQPSENVTFVAERKALSAKDDYVQVITVVNTKVAGATVKKDVTDSAATSAGTTTSATSDNHKVKVSSAWVHKSPKTNDSWFGDLVEWFLTK